MNEFQAEKNHQAKKVPIFLANFFRRYSVRQFAIIIFLILVAQVTIWFIFETFLEPRLSYTYHMVMEISILTISLSLISFPILYYFSYRPLHRTIENLKVAQSQLVNLNQELLVTNKQLHQSRSFTESLLSANEVLSQSLELNLIATTFFDLLYEFVPYDIASILVPISQSKWTVLKSIRCEFGTKIEIDNGQLLDVTSLPYLKAVIDESRTLVIADTRTCEDWQQWPKFNEMRSWLGLPFISDGSLIGICELYKESPNFFTADYLKISETHIRVATAALQNAMLFEQVQAGRERMQMLSHRLVTIQEEERRHIARELHDEAGQGLALLMVDLRLLESNEDHLKGSHVAINRMKETLGKISEGLHNLAIGLRPAGLDHLGIVPVLTQCVEDFAQKNGIEAQFDTIDIDGRLPLGMETAVYRIVQEGLTNIARHAQATRADILLQNCGNKFVIAIEDNGVGFNPEDVDKSKHLGLIGIAERVAMLNGKLEIESSPGVGTTLLVEVPYETARSDY